MERQYSKKNVSIIYTLNLRERMNLTDLQRTFTGALFVLTSCNYCSFFFSYFIIGHDFFALALVF